MLGRNDPLQSMGDGFIFKTNSLEFPPLSICVKQDVLTDNKHSVLKDCIFRGLTIPDSAKQGYVSDLFLHKQLETCRKLTLDFVYLDGKRLCRVRIVYKLKELPTDLYLASHSVKLEDTW